MQPLLCMAGMCLSRSKKLNIRPHRKRSLVQVTRPTVNFSPDQNFFFKIGQRNVVTAEHSSLITFVAMYLDAAGSQDMIILYAMLS